MRGISDERPQHLRLAVPLNNEETVTLWLERSEIFGTRLPVDIMTQSGKHTRNYNNGLHYRGKVEGMEKSLAAFSFFENQVIAVISTGKGNYVLGNMSDEKGNPLPGELVVYNDRHMRLPYTFDCLSDQINAQVKKKWTHNENRERSSGNCQLEEIYFECDYQMYLDHGSSTENVLNFLSGVFNVMAAIYDLHDIKIGIKAAGIWTVPDPYPINSSINALFTFVDTQIQVADFHHLLSTNTNNLGGVAFYGDDLCTYQEEGFFYNYAYSNIHNSYNGFPLYSWTVMVMAHENGHNLGTPHTHWCGWPTGRLDNCGPAAGYYDDGDCPNGPTPESGTVMSYCHLWSEIGIDFTLGFGNWPVYGPTQLIYEEVSTNTCFINPVLNSLSASAASPVCQGSDIVLNATAMPGAMVKWYGPNGYYSELPVSTIANAMPAQSGVYKAVASYMGCSTDTLYFNINVIAAYTAPTQLSASPATVSAGQLSTISVVSGTLQPGSVWHWYADACGGAAVGTGNFAAVNPMVTTQYFARAEGQCGASPCAMVTVVVQNCPGDLNNTGTIDTADLLLFLGAFGCSAVCPIGDFTNDGAVNTSDLLVFLAMFGQLCP